MKKMLPALRPMQPASQARFLSNSILLEESGPPRIMAALIGVLSLFVLGFAAWALLARIDESTPTQGQVMPAGAVRIVQHLEGGLIRDIKVEEGDVVEADQVLVELDTKAVRAELEQLEAAEAALTIKAQRLLAFSNGEPPDFSKFNDQYPGLVADQQAILVVQREALDNQRSVLERQVAEGQVELKSTVKRQQTLKRHLALVEEELEMRTVLLKKGLMTRPVYLETQREVNRARGDLQAVSGEMDRLRESIGESLGRLLELESKARNDALIELGEINAELAQVSRSITKQQDRFDRLNIRSPVRGVVKALYIKTVGGVAAPGEEIVEVVPIDDELVVETRIDPSDVGRISIGQDVSVKVATYDYARFGDLPGRLERISASTFVDKDGTQYYKGIVRLAQNYVGSDSSKNPVLPGMTVQADIVTGDRSVMQYLLKPVYRAMESAFNEK